MLLLLIRKQVFPSGSQQTSYTHVGVRVRSRQYLHRELVWVFDIQPLSLLELAVLEAIDSDGIGFALGSQ